MKKYIPGIMTIATLSIAISVALPAAAESAPKATIPEAGTGIRTVSIQYVPTELSTDRGREKLHARIKQAAREVCGPAGPRDAGGLAMASRNRRCAEQAVSDAMAQINSGRLATAGH
jgi:UrcA family protein